MFPQYDNLSTEQLLQTQLELKKRLVQAHSSGMSPAITQQIQSMLDYLNSELQMKIALEKKNNPDDEESNDNSDGTSLDIG